MNKIVLSVAFLIAMLVGGYFVDDNFKSKVNQLVGVNKSHSTESVGASFSNSSDTLQNMIKTGKVNVSVQSPSKPFHYMVNGVPKGFNVEFLNLLFADSDLTNGKQAFVINTVDNIVDEYSAVPRQLLKTNNQGKPVVDIAIDGLTFSDSDLEGVIYTIPYVQDFGYSLITSRGSNIKTEDDISKSTIGILKGDPDVKTFVRKSFPNAVIVELSDATDAKGQRTWINTAITSGKVDAVIYDYPFGVSEIEGTNLQFAITKLNDSNIQYKIGVRKTDEDLVKALNSAIRKAVNTPEYADLVKKYFSSNQTAAIRSATGSETVYIVKRGDTLGTIAQETLGNIKLYHKIESRNNLANPNLISVGQKLVIPN